MILSLRPEDGMQGEVGEMKDGEHSGVTSDR